MKKEPTLYENFIIEKYNRKSMNDTIKESGLNEKMKGFAYYQFAELTYKVALGMNSKQIRMQKNLQKNANIKDYLSPAELKKIMESEKVIQGLIELGFNYEQIKTVLTQKGIGKNN